MTGKAAARKVKVPDSLADRLLGRLMRVGDGLWREADRRFAKWGMTESHYNLLRILNGEGAPLPQNAIGRRLLSSRALVTKLVDALEDKGLVERRAGGDRRVNLVALTPAGADFLQATIAEAVAAAEEAMRVFAKSEQKALYEWLGRLARE